MREIKFRAWDTVRKKMWSVEEMGRDQLTISVDGRGFINVHSDDLNLSQFLPHMIPLQYTGLKANSKEIYEGDIVRRDCYATKDPRKIAKVCWSEITHGWITESMPWDLSQIKGRVHIIGPAAEPIHKKLEIIGNVYENPELIKKGGD